MRTKEVEAKSILTESKLPDADYVINPYTGCIFGCAYCYASFMGRFVGEGIEAWGDYVYVKVNAVELVRAELGKLSAANRSKSILLSSVTDPYQGAERKYRLTRGILEALAEASYPGPVSILTKSPLVLRDIDVLRRIQHSEVGITITTTDDRLSRWLEVRAPLASRRLEALRTLHDAGIETYAFVGPLLPHFAERADLLDELLSQIADVGVSSVYVEHMNLKRYIRDRMGPRLEEESASVQQAYEEARTDRHRQRLNELLEGLISKHGLRLRMNQVLYHNADGASRDA
jgi:DNA repair photolyase